ncbi:MAG TPA: sigma-70 family RNA polymerase sigma factor [Thermoanaerobaculia bacterium]|nr:sigma-70 family RNA polymerase sigma factor [Thermoanaerobaculia bacterium]
MCEFALDRPVLKDLESSPSQPARRRLASGPGDRISRGRVLLERHFGLIQQRLQSLGRRSSLPDHETDEFLSWALFKLVENNYRILAGWEGRSSFSTYLTVVLVNLMRDYRTHVWGKWRSSAAARRQGTEAVLLERLLLRDGLSIDEAIRQMRSTHGVTLSCLALEEIAAGLPWRFERRRVGEEELRRISVDGRIEDYVERKELACTAVRFRGVFDSLLRELPAESRLLLKLHYRDGLSVATISRLLGQPQKRLYRFRDCCLRKLRRGFESAGLHACDINTLIGFM